MAAGSPDLEFRDTRGLVEISIGPYISHRAKVSYESRIGEADGNKVFHIGRSSSDQGGGWASLFKTYS